MSCLCISRKAWLTFTDAKCAHDFRSSMSKLSRWFLQKEKIAFQVYTEKESICKYKDAEKLNYFSCFAWPVKFTVPKLPYVVRSFSSTGTRYMGRKQAVNKTPHKESKAHHVTNTSTWRSTDLGKTIDKYACEGSWTALRMRGIWPRCCMSRRVQESVTETLTLRLLMSYIYGAPILDVSRSHTTTQHSR